MRPFLTVPIVSPDTRVSNTPSTCWLVFATRFAAPRSIVAIELLLCSFGAHVVLGCFSVLHAAVNFRQTKEEHDESRAAGEGTLLPRNGGRQVR